MGDQATQNSTEQTQNMGQAASTNKSEPIERVSIKQAMNGEADEAMVKSFRNHGFVVFRMDEEWQRLMRSYFEAGKSFFAQPDEAKARFVVSQDEVLNKFPK